MNLRDAIAIVRGLADQDRRADDVTDPPADQIRRWRQCGREAGDLRIVEAIDTLGADYAIGIYSRALSKSDSLRRRAERGRPTVRISLAPEELAWLREHAPPSARRNGGGVSALVARLVRAAMSDPASPLLASEPDGP